MKMYTSTFDTATEAVDNLDRLLCSCLEILDIYRAVRGTFTVGSFGLRRGFFAISLVDVSSGERLGLALCGGLLTCSAIGRCELLSFCDFGAWSWLEWLQSARRINSDTEMASKWRANVGWAFLRVDLDKMLIMAQQSYTEARFTW
jgi:hypothetical protein